MENREIKILRFVSSIPSNPNIDLNKIGLEKVSCEDIKTGQKTVVYSYEIQGKITEEKIKRIAQEKMNKNFLQEQGLYLEVKTYQITKETLFPIDDNLVFTLSDIEKIENNILKYRKNYENYEDLEDEFHFIGNEYEIKNSLIDFIKYYFEYEKKMETSNFTNELSEDFDYFGDEFFYIEEFTEKQQIEKRLTDLKPIADIIFSYLTQLKSGAIGTVKTDEEMDKEFGEIDFFFERNKF